VSIFWLVPPDAESKGTGPTGPSRGRAKNQQIFMRGRLTTLAFGSTPKAPSEPPKKVEFETHSPERAFFLEKIFFSGTILLSWEVI